MKPSSSRATASSSQSVHGWAPRKRNKNENGRITEIAGPREERLAAAAATLFASRGDSFEIREVRGGPLAEPGDPDAAAYAEGAALPNPGAKLAGPSFEEWLATASV